MEQNFIKKGKENIRMKDKKQCKAEECFRKKTARFSKKKKKFSTTNKSISNSSISSSISSFFSFSYSFRIFKWKMFMTVDVECLIRILIPALLLLLLPRIS